MKEKLCNSIAFNREDYSNDSDFWSDVSKIMEILARNKYEMAFRHEDLSIYVLEYNDNRYCGYGNPIVEWTNEDRI